MPWVGTVLGMSCLEYELSWVQIVMSTSWPGHKVTRVRVDLVKSCPGYELSWDELSWVRVVLDTSCHGYELTLVRVVLGTSCPGHELSWVRVVQSPYIQSPMGGKTGWLIFKQHVCFWIKKHTNQCYVCRLAFRICFKDKIACSAVIDYLWFVPRYAINIYVVISTS